MNVHGGSVPHLIKIGTKSTIRFKNPSCYWNSLFYGTEVNDAHIADLNDMGLKWLTSSNPLTQSYLVS